MLISLTFCLNCISERSLSALMRFKRRLYLIIGYSRVSNSHDSPLINYSIFLPHSQVMDSCRDGWNVWNCSSSHVHRFFGNDEMYKLVMDEIYQWNVRKVQNSVDVIMKNWLYRFSLMSKHSCCQSEKWLFELFHLCSAK